MVLCIALISINNHLTFLLATKQATRAPYRLYQRICWFCNST